MNTTDNGVDPVKVLFIVGNGRSGSTMLHNILGQIDGFTGVGELRDVWERGVIKNWSCGCGVAFRDCPFWNEVIGGAFGGWSEVDPERWSRATESFRSRDLPLAFVPPIRRAKLEQLDGLLTTLRTMYTAIADTSGASVIVDSSKNPSFGWVVRHVPGIDVRFLHLVRDAPAVAHSWGQHKEFEPGKKMARKSPLKAALQWDARNLGAELYLRSEGPSMRMRYEDFVRQPRRSVAEIVRWIGADATQLPFLEEHRVVLDRPTHSVFGNEVRFQTGEVDLRVDDRWRSQMATGDVRTVKLLTQPLRARYGYLGSSNAAARDEVRA